MSCRSRHRRTFSRCLLAASLLCGASLGRSQDTRLPSEVLHDVAKGRLENPQRTPDQVEAALKPLLANVQKSGLTPEEEVALAQAYFFTFDGPSARPLFEKHMKRDDRLGRVSMQSLQQMSFFGAKDYALVEKRLEEYRQRFRPVPGDLDHTSRMVGNLSRYYASSGNHAKAVDLIVTDLETLPLDLPYRSFQLLASNFKSFQEAGKAQVAIEWMKKHRDALRARAAAAGQGSSGSPASFAASLQFKHRSGVLHFDPFSDGLFEDDPQYNLEQASLVRTRLAIPRFDRWIEAAEKGGPITDFR